MAALADEQLAELHGLAGELGLAALVEVHDERELERALGVAPRLIGINNRDLTTLQVDLRRTFELRTAIPEGVTVVAESGFSCARAAGVSCPARVSMPCSWARR